MLGPLQGLADPVDRLLLPLQVVMHCIAEPSCTLVERVLASGLQILLFIQARLAGVCELLSPVGDVVAVVGDPVSIVGHAVAPIGHTQALIGSRLQGLQLDALLIERQLALRELQLALLQHPLTLVQLRLPPGESPVLNAVHHQIVAQIERAIRDLSAGWEDERITS